MKVCFLFCNEYFNLFSRIWVPVVIVVFIILVILVIVFIWQCTPVCASKEGYEVTPKIAPVTLTQQTITEETVEEV